MDLSIFASGTGLASIILLIAAVLCIVLYFIQIRNPYILIAALLMIGAGAVCLFIAADVLTIGWDWSAWDGVTAPAADPVTPDATPAPE